MKKLGLLVVLLVVSLIDGRCEQELGFVTASYAPIDYPAKQLPELLAPHVRMLHDMDVHHIRIYVYMSYFWHPHWRKGAEEFYDRYFAEMQAAGIDVLPVVSEYPFSLKHLSYETEPTSMEDWTPELFLTTLERFVQRYGDYFTHIQIWNEPNASSWYFENSPIQTMSWRHYEYANLFMQASKIARAQAPHLKIVSNICGFADEIYHQGFLDRLLYVDKTLESIDVISWHPYPSNKRANSWTTPSLQEDEKFIRLFFTQNCFTKPVELWVTEIGCNMEYYTEAEAEQYFEDMITSWQQTGIQRLYWYTLMDGPEYYAPINRKAMCIKPGALSFLSSLFPSLFRAPAAVGGWQTY